MGIVGVFIARYLALPLPFISSTNNSTVFLPEAVTVEDNERQSPAITMEVVASGLSVPWSIIFTDTDRMLVSERSGAIRIIEKGVLIEKPLYLFDGVSSQSEEGLMGLAVDPAYSENTFIYACYAYEQQGALATRVVRLEDKGMSAENEQVIIDKIPAAQYHAGCRLAFGPDGLLYITTGDATDKTLAQDTQSLAGKILRIHSDGTIPQDNPFPQSPIYSLGHRNPQGIAWDMTSGILLSTEHGPSVFDGPAGGDEINRIIPGGNYGWPIVSHDKAKEGLISPVIQFTPALAPASALVYSGDVFPAWQGDLFFGALKGEGVYRVVFTTDSFDTVEFVEKLPIEIGRVRDVVQGPDGAVYISTSNTDGRGKVTPGDDQIYRLIPSLQK